jgi:hypothetical protein
MKEFGTLGNINGEDPVRHIVRPPNITDRVRDTSLGLEGKGKMTVTIKIVTA